MKLSNECECQLISRSQTTTIKATMNYPPAQQISAARHIARVAQQRIKEETGLGMTLVVCPETQSPRTPEQMLAAIARGLGMHGQSYRLKCRTRDIAELRFIGAMLLRTHYPGITLCEIGGLFGGQNHSSVIHGTTRGSELLRLGDTRFIQKYNTAQKTVNKWLRKEA